MSKWENELSYPDIMLLPQLATYFNITIDELIGYEPQLTREEIRKQYYRLAEAFEKQPFEEVMEECEGLIQNYYSCYSFLLQMAILLVNHAGKGKEPLKVIERAIVLLDRVRLESENVNDAKDALSVEASCYLIIGTPEKALDLLDEQIRPFPQDTEMLAQVYQSMGKLDLAKKATQIALYQHLLMLVGNVNIYIGLYQDEVARSEEMLRRTFVICEEFKLEDLHPNTMAIFYISAAQLYCQHGKLEEAMETLEKYEKLCVHKFFPLYLHGDESFDAMDEWFAEFDLGNGPPRGEKLIKESMLQSIQNSPLLEPLRERKDYKLLIRRLEKFCRADV